MRRAAVIVCLLALCSAGVRAQGEDVNWVFGINAGLSFSGGLPVEFTGTKIHATGGTAAISDATGHLLFYSDGFRVWNKNHKVMPNGSNLGGNENPTWFATQQALIVPWPGTNCKKYFIFAVGHVNKPGLYYSVVDLSEGLGAVIAKKVKLPGDFTDFAEKLAAYRTGDRFWVVAHGFKSGKNNTDAVNSSFYAYSVDASGVAAPVVSQAGSPHTTSSQDTGFAAQGQMKISPDGSMIASALRSGVVEVVKFDPKTGMVSEPRITFDLSTMKSPFTTRSVYGLEFSPDSTQLYVTTFRTPPSGPENQLLQLSLLPVLGKWEVVGKGKAGNDFGALQLGPDGRICGPCCVSGSDDGAASRRHQRAEQAWYEM